VPACKDCQASRISIVHSIIVLGFFWSPVFAQTDSERMAELEQQVSLLVEQLAELRAEIDGVKAAGETVEIASLRSDVARANAAALDATRSAEKWKDATSVTHLAGYASADYVSVENGPAAFAVNFNPMFHFLYDDKILWEAELEFEASEDGSTDIGLEYSTIDWFLTDRLTLVAGKFLSPVGNFRQNLHPSWINKFPSAPPGFGHDGAAPVSEIGLQLRGVAPLGANRRITYAAYVGNGPQIESEDGEIHAVEAEGFASNPDDQVILGGRVSFLPVSNLEVALSIAAGDVAVVTDDGVAISGDATRAYDILGFDANFRWKDLDLRAEYVSQEVGAQPLSIAPDGAKWETWYAQAAHKFRDGKWEGVVRYTDFMSPHKDDIQEQLAFGINYLITPSAMFKVGYESNSGEPGETTDSDRWIMQIAYGY